MAACQPFLHCHHVVPLPVEMNGGILPSLLLRYERNIGPGVMRMRCEM
jgi:hypothetical protein